MTASKILNGEYVDLFASGEVEATKTADALRIEMFEARHGVRPPPLLRRVPSVGLDDKGNRQLHITLPWMEEDS